MKMKPFVLCGLLAIVVAGMTGCPLVKAPDYQVALLVGPTTIDLGSTLDTATFKVSKSFTSKPMAPFTTVPSAKWAACDPSTGNSTGPQDSVVITVTVDRNLMEAAENETTILVSAENVASKSVTVKAQLPIVAQFAADSTLVYLGEAVQFIDQSFEQVGEEKIITSYEWDFGDNSMGPDRLERNPSHIYTAPGDYTVSLKVSNGSFTHKRTRDKYITITRKQPPTAEFYAAKQVVVANTAVGFRDLSVAGSAPILGYVWDFGDGTLGPERFASSPQHIYASADIYETYKTISLRVATEHGEDTETKPDYITLYSPGKPGDPNLGSLNSEMDKSGTAASPVFGSELAVEAAALDTACAAHQVTREGALHVFTLTLTSTTQAVLKLAVPTGAQPGTVFFGVCDREMANEALLAAAVESKVPVAMLAAPYGDPVALKPVVLAAVRSLNLTGRALGEPDYKAVAMGSGNGAWVAWMLGSLDGRVVAVAPEGIELTWAEGAVLADMGPLDAFKTGEQPAIVSAASGVLDVPGAGKINVSPALAAALAE